MDGDGRYDGGREMEGYDCGVWRVYYLPREEQLKRSEGSIGERQFTLPFMAAAMGLTGL